MNEIVDGPQRSFFTPFVEGDPLTLFLGVLLITIGIFHLVLSFRIVVQRRTPVSSGIHAILLFSGPCLVLLFLLRLLPTSLPSIFLSGIDADLPLKHALEQTSFFGTLSLAIFVPNLLLTILALTRSNQISAMNS